MIKKMKDITKKDLLILGIVAFVMYKINGIHFNISGKKAPCGCGGTV